MKVLRDYIGLKVSGSDCCACRSTLVSLPMASSLQKLQRSQSKISVCKIENEAKQAI